MRCAPDRAPSKFPIDDDGNPRIYYPGDYNICVPGHRDIDYREQVLIEHGVDTQVITLTTPGTHVETPETAVRFAALVNDAFAEVVRTKRGRFTALATLPLNDPAASVKELERACRELGLRGAMLFSNVNGVGLERRAILAALRSGQRSGRGALHPSHASGGRGGDDGLLADAAGRIPVRHHAGRGEDRVQRRRRSGFRASRGRCATWAARFRIWPNGWIAASKRSANAARISPSRPREYLKTVLLRHGEFQSARHPTGHRFRRASEHILAGSDYPHQIGSIPQDARDRAGLPVSDAATAAIYGGNAARLLGLA